MSRTQSWKIYWIGEIESSVIFNQNEMGKERLKLRSYHGMFTGIKDNSGTTGYTFSWNPCTPFSQGTKCEDTLVCQQTGSVYVPIADEVSSFDVNGDGTISIIYHSVTGSEGKIRRAIIKLKCDPSQPDRGTLDPFTEKSNPAAENKINYTSTFTSKYACPESEGLSAGSILLIVFFPLVLVYFIAGLLFNKIHKGVNSFPEMIPNHSFWGDLPFLVKDGCVFTFQGIAGCCKRVSMKFKGDSYAEI
ncbi:cation-dependent mannose-6-phosphate receptor-like isoform X3 [Stylophora pistillata]|uniref:cation-dependent mannose-6-phosphate receptor-like isoform X3 n=1 Tax=Stylophora pistillata TaxID=50429 RepID=UPI000C047384|nr:cation-dependent mannose-6-phosphate receptor-like isoform X3 [Stylophora pistillata]